MPTRGNPVFAWLDRQRANVRRQSGQGVRPTDVRHRHPRLQVGAGPLRRYNHSLVYCSLVVGGRRTRDRRLSGEIAGTALPSRSHRLRAGHLTRVSSPQPEWLALDLVEISAKGAYGQPD